MALIKCNGCGHMISDKARKCPKCGYLLENEDFVSDRKDYRNYAPKRQLKVQEYKEQYHEKSSSNLILIIGVLLCFIIAIVAVVVCVFLMNKNNPIDNQLTEPISTQETARTYSSTTDDVSSIKANNVSSSTPRQIKEPSYSAGETQYDFVCKRYVSDSDLIGLSKKELRIMRNWIYARKGYIFKSQDLREYFGRMSWYHPRYSDVSHMLSEMEKDNVYKIKSYE